MKRIQGKRWVVLAFTKAKDGGDVFGFAGSMQVRARCIGELLASVAWCHGCPAGCIEVDAAEARANVRRGMPVDDRTVAEIARQAGTDDHKAVRRWAARIVRERAEATRRGWAVRAPLFDGRPSARIQHRP